MMGVALPARPTGGAGLRSVLFQPLASLPRFVLCADQVFPSPRTTDRTNALDGEDSDDEDDVRGNHLGSVGPESTESYAYTQPQQPNNSEIYNATPYDPSAGGMDEGAYYGYDNYSQQPHPQEHYPEYEQQQQQPAGVGRSLSKGAADALAYGSAGGSGAGHSSSDGHDYTSTHSAGPVMSETFQPDRKPVAAMAAAFGGPRSNVPGSGGDDPFSAGGVGRNHY